MKKLGEKGRRLLRRVFMLLGVAAVSMTFAACYGMPVGPHDESPPRENPIEEEGDESKQ
ncbi:MAG: hypothetical protein FWE09_09410 [Treponema sp.]|nr:hypothetical protein [Treponema sp.]